MMLHDKKYAYISLYLLIALLPFELIFSSVATVLFLIIVVLSSKRTDFIRLLSPNMAYLVAIYFLVTCIGFFYSDNKEVVDERVVRQLPMLILPIGIVLLNMEDKHKEMTKKIFVYACLVFSIFSLSKLLFNFANNYNLRFQYNFVQSSMYHFHFPYDSLYINIAYIFLLFGNFSKNVKRTLGLIFFIVIFLFGVRIGISTFLMLTAFYVLINIKNMFKWQNLFIIGILIGLISLLLTTSPYVKDKYYDTLNRIGLVKDDKISKTGKNYHKMNLRYELWSSTVTAIKKKPFFGYGTGGGIAELRKQYKYRSLKNRNNFNSHNQYLTTTLQFGFFGLIVLLYIMGKLAFLAVKKYNIEHILYILVIGIAFITESFLIRHKGIFIFSLFMTIFLDCYKKDLGNGDKSLIH